VRRVYAGNAGIPFEAAPEPKEICYIGLGEKPGNKAAALEAFRQLGVVVGDALGNTLTLIDGLAVIGGGISAAWPLFMPSLISELNGSYIGSEGRIFRRLSSVAFSLEDAEQRKRFLADETLEITVPGSSKKITYDPLQRIGVGISRLGTSEAIAIGAYAFALSQLDQR